MNEHRIRAKRRPCRSTLKHWVRTVSTHPSSLVCDQVETRRIEMPLKLPHHARAAGAPPPARERRRTVSKLLALFCIGAFSLIAAATAAARNDAAAGLCAFHEWTTVNGTVATSTFRVVQDGCTVSLVSIEHLPTAPTPSSTVPRLETSRRARPATRLPSTSNAASTPRPISCWARRCCTRRPVDLQATPFRVACPAAAVAPVPAAPAAPAAAPAAAQHRQWHRLRPSLRQSWPRQS